MNDIIWSNKIDEILNNGISLEPIGVKNWALPRQEALQALNKFIDIQIPILGGDVCELVGETIQYNYDNWYCDRLHNESDSDFVSRSINKAIEYIEHYNNRKFAKIFFSFVPEI